jgi:hypothetical protein
MSVEYVIEFTLLCSKCGKELNTVDMLNDDDVVDGTVYVVPCSCTEVGRC